MESWWDAYCWHVLIAVCVVGMVVVLLLEAREP